MKERGIKGRMLLVTSLHAETPRGVPHYSVAKAGVTALHEGARKGLWSPRDTRQRDSAWDRVS